MPTIVYEKKIRSAFDAITETAEYSIQGAAKKTPIQKLHYLENGAIFLYKIFSDY